MLQLWLERTPSLSDSYFSFWEKYKLAVKRWLDDECLEPALVGRTISSLLSLEFHFHGLEVP